MNQNCGPGKWVEFKAMDRDFITWGVSGLSPSTTASFRTDSTDAWIPMTFDYAASTVVAYFAGPDAINPGSAHILTATTHIDIMVVDGGVTRILDGGFIRLLR